MSKERRLENFSLCLSIWDARGYVVDTSRNHVSTSRNSYLVSNRKAHKILSKLRKILGKKLVP